MIIKGHVVDAENLYKSHNLKYTPLPSFQWGCRNSPNYRKEIDENILSNKKLMRLYSSKMKLDKDITFDFFLLGAGPKEQIYPNFGDIFKPKNYNSVSIIFQGNWAARNFIPFTPWMLIHRSFHAISQFGGFIKENNFNKIQEITKNILLELEIVELNFISSKLDNYKNWDYKTEARTTTSLLDDLKYVDLNDQDNHVNYLFPFRSARKKMRLISLDLVCEFFAQKCMSGRIKLFDVDKIPDVVVPIDNKDLLKQRYKEQDGKIDSLYETIFELIKGNVYCF